MRCFRLLIEYDGTDFHGWQFQPDRRTVQGELESALKKMFGEPISLIGAGRTDAGVHARGQVAHFHTDNCKLKVDQIQRGINSLIGEDVKLRAVEEVEPDFHARFKVVRRHYSYRILRSLQPLERRRAWTPRWNWDDAKAVTMTKNLIGKHSFRAFCRSREGEKEYIATLEAADWVADLDGVRFFITADRFFHQMVRGIVGALYDHARGYLSAEDFLELLNNPAGNAMVRFAPAKGLVLERVDY